MSTMKTLTKLDSKSGYESRLVAFSFTARKFKLIPKFRIQYKYTVKNTHALSFFIFNGEMISTFSRGSDCFQMPPDSYPDNPIRQSTPQTPTSSSPVQSLPRSDTFFSEIISYLPSSPSTLPTTSISNSPTHTVTSQPTTSNFLFTSEPSSRSHMDPFRSHNPTADTASPPSPVLELQMHDDLDDNQQPVGTLKHSPPGSIAADEHNLTVIGVSAPTPYTSTPIIHTLQASPWRESSVSTKLEPQRTRRAIKSDYILHAIQTTSLKVDSQEEALKQDMQHAKKGIHISTQAITTQKAMEKSSRFTN